MSRKREAPRPAAERNQVTPDGDLWLRVLESTAQSDPARRSAMSSLLGRSRAGSCCRAGFPASAIWSA